MSSSSSSAISSTAPMLGGSSLSSSSIGTFPRQNGAIWGASALPSASPSLNSFSALTGDSALVSTRVAAIASSSRTFARSSSSSAAALPAPASSSSSSSSAAAMPVPTSSSSSSSSVPNSSVSPMPPSLPPKKRHQLEALFQEMCVYVPTSLLMPSLFPGLSNEQFHQLEEYPWPLLFSVPDLEDKWSQLIKNLAADFRLVGTPESELIPPIERAYALQQIRLSEKFSIPQRQKEERNAYIQQLIDQYHFSSDEIAGSFNKQFQQRLQQFGAMQRLKQQHQNGIALLRTMAQQWCDAPSSSLTERSASGLDALLFNAAKTLAIWSPYKMEAAKKTEAEDVLKTLDSPLQPAFIALAASFRKEIASLGLSSERESYIIKLFQPVLLQLSEYHRLFGQNKSLAQVALEIHNQHVKMWMQTKNEKDAKIRIHFNHDLNIKVPRNGYLCWLKYSFFTCFNVPVWRQRLCVMGRSIQAKNPFATVAEVLPKEVFIDPATGQSQHTLHFTEGFRGPGGSDEDLEGHLLSIIYNHLSESFSPPALNAQSSSTSSSAASASTASSQASGSAQQKHKD